ncbi:MAG TPA: P-loop NTPase [Bryobacteraceae bacterium]|nr:P-loop NTPase [Bryobacteraceae bacterium]
MSTFMRHPESLSMSALSLLLIGPDEKRRRAVAQAFAGPQGVITRELSAYPLVDDLPGITEGGYDGVIIDLDASPEKALDVVENLCGSNNSITVMVFSARSDSELLVRCMRAGAREFLTEPVLSGSAAEALVRAAVRRDEIRGQKTATGKLVVFVGSKGGCGVTTLASNVAVALAQYGKVALLDLDLYLGDAALMLGLSGKFTALDAFENLHRLDVDFLSGLMEKHSSGVAVLGSPDKIPTAEPSRKGLDQLLNVAREGFGYVVVDAGCYSIDSYQVLFDMAAVVYLVTQVSVAELRNTNRFVTRYFSGAGEKKLEIVLNRYDARNLEIDDNAIEKALTRPAKWRIPNDFTAVYHAQNAGVPLVLQKGRIGRAITGIAKSVSGQGSAPEKKKMFSMFG